eukprot:CAMPEP_0194730578 /NCGR_PEP_ID=MMETSP0296-20130528/53312_1 /TAXON_ID=39354 /ORGANISM="Heterosigma akashiwo, Strain CCMP2393" /LENGTH=85 /DNA_ID=CAMNT_0039637683 /DNA_START=312 /DNA_END=569 /DNA_ORIENTATION=-
MVLCHDSVPCDLGNDTGGRDAVLGCVPLYDRLPIVAHLLGQAVAIDEDVRSNGAAAAAAAASAAAAAARLLLLESGHNLFGCKSH